MFAKRPTCGALAVSCKLDCWELGSSSLLSGSDFCRSSRLAGPAKPTPFFAELFKEAKQLGQITSAADCDTPAGARNVVDSPNGSAIQFVLRRARGQHELASP